MEWKIDEEARAHAQAFADELAALMKKYDAEFNANISTYGYEGYTVEPEFCFNCCNNTVFVGTFSDGSDLEVE